MISNNENSKFSRNRKRRIERQTKMDDIMKLLLSKIKSEKKRKIKTLIKLKN